ncbi:MAG TPA: ribosome biogenesis GTPase Der [Rhodospirillaceae bacterium]|nr:ribosome biogenesis GTPase Der [Rhodospirillaceae bacterium]
MTNSFSIVLAGRPNVGKSTLFNRLVGKAMAIIDDQPGVTRDWREGEGDLFGLYFDLYDTAGLEYERPSGSLAARTASRTKEAMERADVLLMMVDGREGLSDDDKTVARELRKANKPIIVLVNKCEGPNLPDGYHEAMSLGFEKVIALSAKHGENLYDLYEALKPLAPESAFVSKSEEEEEEERALHIAIVGRPNAGKSTLVNALIGQDRMLTGPEAGLTRDSIHIHWEHEGRAIRLVDTAGMRKRARIDEKLEKVSVKESLRAIRLAHVVILVLDADMPFDKQDYTIAQHVEKEGRALIIAINKWDALKERTETLKMIRSKIEASLAQLAGVPLVPISALKGRNLDDLMKEVTSIYELWNKRVSTGQLNRWLEGMISTHPPPIVGGRRIKPRYVTQLKSRPPTFVMAGNKLSDLPESYVRFLTNGLRKAFDFNGVPIRWILKKSDNPYEGKKKK